MMKYTGIVLILGLQFFLPPTEASPAKSGQTSVVYKPENGRITLYDEWLEYGSSNNKTPCDAPASKEFLGLDQKQQVEVIRRKCDLELYSYGKNGVEKVAISSVEIEQQEVCGESSPKIFAKIGLQKQHSFFVTTIEPTSKNSAFAKAERAPKDIPYAVLESALPDWVASSEEKPLIQTFTYPSGGEWKYIVSVEASRIVSGDPDKGYANGKIRSTIFFVANDQKALQITPKDVHLEVFYGKITTFLGTHQMGSSERPEIFLGDKDEVNMIILGRQLDDLTFPYFPPGGC